MLGDKLVFPLVAFQRQKRRSPISKNFDIIDQKSKSSDLLLEQLRMFLPNLEENSTTRKFYIISVRFVDKRDICTHLFTNNYVNMSKNKKDPLFSMHIK